MTAAPRLKSTSRRGLVVALGSVLAAAGCTLPRPVPTYTLYRVRAEHIAIVAPQASWHKKVDQFMVYMASRRKGVERWESQAPRFAVLNGTIVCVAEPALAPEPPNRESDLTLFASVFWRKLITDSETPLERPIARRYDFEAAPDLPKDRQHLIGECVRALAAR